MYVKESLSYEEDKKLYYESLESFNETEDLNELFVFLEDQCVKTWGEIVNRNLSNIKKPSMSPNKFFLEEDK